MPTFFLHSHSELVNLAMACRIAAQKEREYAAAQTSVSVKHTHLDCAGYYDRQASRFHDAAKLQELMWKIHRKG